MKKLNILGICGSPKKNLFSSSWFLLEQALQAASEEGAETKMVQLADYNILPCEGCGQCMNHNRCHLLSNKNDQLTKLFDECVWADGFIFSSPVYALALPAIWKNWIDRCEPCSDEDLKYEYYCYDIVQGVKGKAFRGKVAGQIVVAAGPGHEWALASLMPAFTAVKLSMVASVGLSLIEYDFQPGIKSQPWAKDIKEAKFAIDIARSVGKRVYETIGYSTFLIDKHNKSEVMSEHSQFLSAHLVTFDDKPFYFDSNFADFFILVVAGQQASYGAKKWLEYFKGQIETHDLKKISLVNIASVGQLPHFITKKFIKLKIKDNLPNVISIFDWDLDFANQFGFDHNSNQPYILLFDARDKTVKLNCQKIFSDANSSELLSNVLKLI